LDRELEDDSDDESVEENDGFFAKMGNSLGDQLGNSLAEAFSAILSAPATASSGLDKSQPLPGHAAHLSQLGNHNYEEPSLFPAASEEVSPFPSRDLLLHDTIYSRSLARAHQHYHSQNHHSQQRLQQRQQQHQQEEPLRVHHCPMTHHVNQQHLLRQQLLQQQQTKKTKEEETSNMETYAEKQARLKVLYESQNLGRNSPVYNPRAPW